MAGEQGQANTTATEDTDDKDFASGFNGTGPTETPAAASPAPAAEEPSSAPQPETAPAPEPAPPPPPEPEFVQVTKADWETVTQRAAKVEEISATLDKRFDQVLGKMGRTLDSKLAALQQATPAGQAVVVDDEDFAELLKEFPESGAATVAGLRKVVAKLKGTGGADPEAIEKVVGGRIDTLRSEIVNASLEAVFPGWEEEVKTEQFGAWLQSQAQDVQALAASAKVGDAAKMLRLYEKSKETPPPPPPAPPAPAAAATQASARARIASAVPPKGDGGPPAGPSAEDDFAAGFRSG